MAEVSVSIKQVGSAIVVKVGRKTESFDMVHLTRYQIVDKARWICITYGGAFSEETVLDILEGR